jgi:branched-chain amino acid transport system substrate-binding protein
MAAQGQQDVVVTYRVDPSNEGLASSLSDAVRARGGQAVRGPVYPGGTTSFGPAVALLAQKVESLDSEGAVYLAGFGEVADYLAAASAEDGLVQRPFYGGDGSAKSQALIDDRVAAKMAADSGGLPSPLLAVPPRALRDARATISAIERKSGQDVDAFVLAAYDALGIGVQALQAAGPDADGNTLRFAFAAAARDYQGVTGPVVLNAAGDRATGTFAFWAICRAGSRYEWRTIGTWSPPREPGPGTVRVSSCADAAPNAPR